MWWQRMSPVPCPCQDPNWHLWFHCGLCDLGHYCTNHGVLLWTHRSCELPVDWVPVSLVPGGSFCSHPQVSAWDEEWGEWSAGAGRNCTCSRVAGSQETRFSRRPQPYSTLRLRRLCLLLTACFAADSSLPGAGTVATSAFCRLCGSQWLCCFSCSSLGSLGSSGNSHRVALPFPWRSLLFFSSHSWAPCEYLPYDADDSSHLGCFGVWKLIDLLSTLAMGSNISYRTLEWPTPLKLGPKPVHIWFDIIIPECSLFSPHNNLEYSWACGN